MLKNPICEAYSDLPVKFDIDSLKAESKPKAEKENVEISKRPRDFLNVPDKNWVILPMFKYHLDHLKPRMSCRTDKYMRMQFKNFLDHVPDSYVNITLSDAGQSKSPCPSRKSLTGQFYGADFKLAPVPKTVDPRSTFTSRSTKSK